MSYVSPGPMIYSTQELGKNRPNLEKFEHRLEAKFLRMIVVETGNNNIRSYKGMKSKSKSAFSFRVHIIFITSSKGKCC